MSDGVLSRICTVGETCLPLHREYEEAGFPEAHPGIEFWQISLEAMRLDFALVQTNMLRRVVELWFISLLKNGLYQASAALYCSILLSTTPRLLIYYSSTTPLLLL